MKKDSGVCAVEGCGGDVAARGWCRRHYARWYTKGTLDARPWQHQDACAIEGCDRPAESGGHCSMHRWRIRTTGEPGPAARLRQPQQGLCSEDGCDREQVTSGLCKAHYRRVKDGRTLTGPVRARMKREGECAVDGCGREVFGRGYCQMHLTRIRRHGDPGPAQTLSPGPGNGYRKITVDGKLMLEHRVVMEHHLGRPLWPDENVHHMNRRRADNRLENLELWTTAQPGGGRVEDLVAFYVERYPELAAQVLRKVKAKGRRSR